MKIIIFIFTLIFTYHLSLAEQTSSAENNLPALPALEGSEHTDAEYTESSDEKNSLWQRIKIFFGLAEDDSATKHIQINSIAEVKNKDDSTAPYKEPVSDNKKPVNTAEKIHESDNLRHADNNSGSKEEHINTSENAPEVSKLPQENLGQAKNSPEEHIVPEGKNREDQAPEHPTEVTELGEDLKLPVLPVDAENMNTEIKSHSDIQPQTTDKISEGEVGKHNSINEKNAHDAIKNEPNLKTVDNQAVDAKSPLPEETPKPLAPVQSAVPDFKNTTAGNKDNNGNKVSAPSMNENEVNTGPENVNKKPDTLPVASLNESVEEKSSENVQVEAMKNQNDITSEVVPEVRDLGEDFKLPQLPSETQNLDTVNSDNSSVASAGKGNNNTNEVNAKNADGPPVQLSIPNEKTSKNLIIEPASVSSTTVQNNLPENTKSESVSSNEKKEINPNNAVNIVPAYSSELNVKEDEPKIDKTELLISAPSVSNLKVIKEEKVIPADDVQMEFVKNEAQVLILPDDDIVLGDPTEKAMLEQMDFTSYIEIFWNKYYDFVREPQRLKMEKFIKDYDKNFNEHSEV